MTSPNRFEGLPLAEVFRLSASRMRDAAPIIQALHGYPHLALARDLNELAARLSQVAQEVAQIELDHETAETVFRASRGGEARA